REFREGRFAELLRLLMPFPGRLEFAIRLALICALTTLVVEIYQTPEPALTVYLVFFLNKSDRGTSLILSVAMLALFTLIVSSVILVAIFVIDQPVWRVASVAAISLGLLFLASASKLRPIGGTVALIVAFALDELGTVHGGEIATRALLYVWLFVGIPAGVSICVNLLLAPSPRFLAEQALARRLRLAAAMLGATEDAGIRRDFTECLREGNGELLKWLKLALVEKSAARERIEALRQAATSSFAILVLIDVMDRDAGAALPVPLRERLTLTLDAMARILDDGGYPVDIEFEGAADGEPSLPPRTAEVFSGVRETLMTFAEAAPDTQPPGPEKKSGGFFLPDAFTNPEHVRYALKTTAAAMFCYVLYLLLDWPGIHTIFITCYIVSLGTTAETVEKLTLRILGCLVGAASGIAAIVYLIPSVTSIGALMIVVFFGALVSAWVAAGSPRIAYAGFQIAFAFFLCVIQGSGPSFDMTTARDRVIGILLGNIVVFVLFTNVWPVSVGKRIDPAIAALLRRFSGLLTEVSKPVRRSQAPEAQEMLSGIERDLNLALYEPPSLRPDDSWIGVRRQAAEDIGALLGPLLLSVDKDFRFSAQIASRLRSLADSLDAAEEAPSSVSAGVAASDEPLKEDHESAQLPFHDAITRRLDSLEEAFGRESEANRKANYVSA
ncbi:MAG: FUSC family protein, partial [Methylocella sp.]